MIYRHVPHTDVPLDAIIITDNWLLPIRAKPVQTCIR